MSADRIVYCLERVSDYRDFERLCSALLAGTREGHIEVGEGKRAVVLDTAPLCWQCPVGLDVEALSGHADLGEELAEFRTRDDDDSEEVDSSAATEAPTV